MPEKQHVRSGKLIKKVKIEMNDERQQEYSLRSLRVRKVGARRKNKARVTVCLELDEQMWDRQREIDLVSGRLNDLIAKAEADIAANKVRELDEVLRNA